MLKESIKTISRAIFTISAVLSLTGCFLDGGGGDNGDSDTNIGWVKITNPTSEEIFELPGFQEALEISGEAFYVASTTRTECDCYAFLVHCLWSYVRCEDNVVGDGARISIVNLTMGAEGLVTSHGDNWKGVVPLTTGQNIIQVRAEDDEGNYAVDTLNVTANYPLGDADIWQFGSAEDDSSSGIAIDANGNLYLTGTTGGDLAGTGNAGSNDAFIAKYDTAGNQLWIKQFDSESSDSGSGIAIDANGNLYLTGTTGGDLAGTGNAGSLDVFITKYDTSGNRLWIKQFGTEHLDIGTEIAVDANGNSYVTGWTDGDLAGTGFAGYYDAFIAKYDTSGNRLWIKQFGTERIEQGNGIAVDAKGNSYVTGETGGNLDGTGDPVDYDAFLTKYDTSGNQLWIKRVFLEDWNLRGKTIAVDANGNSYIAGGGDLLGGGLGSTKAFIAKYDTSGNRLWINVYGANRERAYGIAIDANGNSYVTGTASLDYDYPQYDFDIAKYDTSGNRLWIKHFGLFSSNERGADIVVDLNGIIYVTGTTDGDLTGIGNAGGIDVFIARLYP